MSTAHGPPSDLFSLPLSAPMPVSKLEFGGEERFQSAPEKVHAVLTDLDAMARTIPDLVSAKRTSADAVHCVIRPGFSFLRGKLDMVIELTSRMPPTEAALRATAKGIGAEIVVESAMHVHPDGDGSRLEWQARVSKLAGLASAISTSLIQAAAEQVIRKTWQSVRKELNEVAD
jgi:carbon monoxide dehydrogenase subunit G